MEEVEEVIVLRRLSSPCGEFFADCPNFSIPLGSFGRRPWMS